jgi:hypothetical protein
MPPKIWLLALLVMSSVLWMAAGCTPTEEEPPPAPGLCENNGWTQRAFVDDGVFGVLRRDLAADFSAPTTDGDWTLSERWSGCESYVFVPDSLVVSPLDGTPLLESADDLAELLEKSPDNVHYFFVSTSQVNTEVDAMVEGMTGRIEELLAELGPRRRSWWSERLHVLDRGSLRLQNWITDAMISTGRGFAIDRFQRIRGFGNLADVTRRDPALEQAGAWPWRANLAYLAHEPLYYNYESDRQDMLDADEPTAVYLFYEEDNANNGRRHVWVDLPDAQTMATFDTMMVDLRHTCDTSTQEFGNCDAWDAIQELWLCDADDPDSCDTEIARYITTYHREGRWLVDVSQLLPLLQDGGRTRFRIGGVRFGHFNTVRILFSNRDKGARPFEATYLWSGGQHNANYAADHPPIEVDIPADATRVYLSMTLSGHGQGGDDNCAEFCDHQHTFSIGGNSVTADHPDMGDTEGCLKQIDRGTVPNQNGTWWFSRSSWCPGKQVDPWVWDISDWVTPGQTATIAYTTNYGPNIDDGWIDMHSWMTFWK